MNNYTIIKVKKFQKKDYNYKTVTILHEGKAYQVNFDRTDIKDFIEENISDHKEWVKENYKNWQDESDSELAKEMSYSAWEDTEMIHSYINSIELSEFDELMDYAPEVKEPEPTGISGYISKQLDIILKPLKEAKV